MSNERDLRTCEACGRDCSPVEMNPGLFELQRVLRGLRDSVKGLEGYWTESVDTWMQAADELLERIKPQPPHVS